MTRVLVAYATRCGSTAEVAAAIAQILVEVGLAAEVRPMGEIRDLRAYRAVVVGSPIRGGRWLPEATEFLRRNREHLRRMPVAYFALGLSLREGAEEARTEAAAALDPARELVAPIAVGLFAGALDPRKPSPLLRLLMQLIKAPVGDFRDPAAVHAWASVLGEKLKGKT